MTTKSPGPLYPNCKPWDLEPHYSKHIHHMTSEGLHSKAAIAEQLALRDLRIADLESQLEAQTGHLEQGAALLRGYIRQDQDAGMIITKERDMWMRAEGARKAAAKSVKAKP